MYKSVWEFFFFLESMEKITTNEKNLDRFDKKITDLKKKNSVNLYRLILG